MLRFVYSNTKFIIFKIKIINKVTGFGSRETINIYFLISNSEEKL